MKALQIEAPGKPVWKDVETPEAGTGQVLVKVAAVTTCPHWDMHIMDGEPMFPGGTLTYPYVVGQPGHEATGEAAAVGAGVETVRVGDRVAMWRDQGPTRHGFYAEYAVADAENVLVVPDALPAQGIASLELAMCVQVSFDQLLALGMVEGRRFAVGGLGPAGLIAVQMAKAQGAREVIAVDPVVERRELAMTLGADRAIEPTQDAFPHDRFSDEAIEAAIDCTGLKASIEYLMHRTRHALAIFGVLREDVIFGANHWRRGLTLMGYGSHNRQAAERALSLIEAGRVKLEPLVSATLPFTEYAKGVEMLRRKEAVKVCFVP